MTADLIVRGARISDGTGLPAFTGDVEVRDGRITRVGRIPEHVRAARTIDADGLDLVPGFVDVHTHYDAQVFFEASASPSSWHGVTTVVNGNCGFTLAPSKPADLEWLVLMLAKVEGMSVDALRAGVEFDGGSVGDYLARLDGRIGVNVASYVGHAAVRRWVMGPDASTRAATADEVQAMAELVDLAMREGAIGFSTSQLDGHADHEGRPVPPNLASSEEIVALCSVLADFAEGITQIQSRTFTLGYDAIDRALLPAMARASGGKPLHTNFLVRFANAPDAWRTCLDALEAWAAEGLRIYPMASSNPKGLHLTLADTILLDEMPTFRRTLALDMPARIAALRDPDVRNALRVDFADPGRQMTWSWGSFLVATVRDAANASLVGRSVESIAAERHSDPFETFIDLALAEDLETIFVIDRPVRPEDREVIRYLLAHPLTMPGTSDGGAHVNTFCGADFTTRVLTDYVDDEFTFEAAVRKLSSLPAASIGLFDRGEIKPGYAADLVLLDRSRLAVGGARLLRDFPTGASRLVWDQQGYVATIVNGAVLIEDGAPTGATAGSVLRFNQR